MGTKQGQQDSLSLTQRRGCGACMAGVVMNAETLTIQRCDDCRLFECDADAASAVVGLLLILDHVYQSNPALSVTEAFEQLPRTKILSVVPASPVPASPAPFTETRAIRGVREAAQLVRTTFAHRLPTYDSVYEAMRIKGVAAEDRHEIFARLRERLLGTRGGGDLTGTLNKMTAESAARALESVIS